MVRRIKFLSILFATLLTLTGCNTSCTAVKQAKALKDCKYSFSKVDHVGLMGFSDLQDMTSITGALTIAQALTGNSTSVPLTFTVHLNVQNPNETTAAIERLYYKVYLDSIQVADGSTTQNFQVVGGGTADLALPLKADLVQLLKSDQRTKVVKVVKNFVGLGKEQTEVMVKIKPTIAIGNRTLTSPVFIPFKFKYPK